MRLERADAGMMIDWLILSVVGMALLGMQGANSDSHTIRLELPIAEAPGGDGSTGAAPVEPLPDRGALTEMLRRVYHLPRLEAVQVASAIHETVAIFNLPAELLMSLIATESSFEMDARSSVGAVGLAQVRPGIWGHLGYDVYDTRENLWAAATILQLYRGYCGNLVCALKAYNVGITAWRNKTNEAAAQRYMDKIRGYQRRELLTER